MNEKTVEHAYQVICALREEYAEGVIKDHQIPPLVNIHTGQDTGFAVIIQLANKYEYTDAVLNDWKERLHADEYTVTAKRNQLTVKFSVHYGREKATQGR